MESVPAPLVLDGILGIRTIDAIRRTLLQAMAEQAVVAVDCNRAESVDLSFIQLLLAARLSAERTGRAVKLSSPASGALRDALERGGFVSATGADKPDGDPFWSPAP